MTKRRNEDADLVKAWKEGEPIDVKLSPQSTSVLSIRVPDDLMMALTQLARARNVSTSRLAREIIERGLEPHHPETPEQLARMFQRWVDEGLAHPAKKKEGREGFEKRGGYAAPKASISQMKPPPRGPALRAKRKSSKKSK